MMAEEAGLDRTEDASPRRLEEARQRGQVAFSPEMTGAAVVLTAVIVLFAYGQDIGGGLLDLFRSELARLHRGDFDRVAVQILFGRLFERFLVILGVFFGLILAAAFGASIIQVGFLLSPERMEPDFSRLSPANGWKRLWSLGGLLKGGLGLLKVAALGGIVWWLLRDRVGSMIALDRGRLRAAAAVSWETTGKVALWLAAALAAFGALDYVVQRRRFMQSLRMTKQEVKDEQKMLEGDPLIKQRVRQLQRDRARMKMMRAVPSATVVVTNPTHIAIALRYDLAKKGAPVVVAKGAGAIAERIKELARRHGVPVLERPPLARALYKVAHLGREIPTELFKAVAEVIALVYQLRKPA